MILVAALLALAGAADAWTESLRWEWQVA
jgi:hypothetical protein